MTRWLLRRPGPAADRHGQERNQSPQKQKRRDEKQQREKGVHRPSLLAVSLPYEKGYDPFGAR